MRYGMGYGMDFLFRCFVDQRQWFGQGMGCWHVLAMTLCTDNIVVDIFGAMFAVYSISKGFDFVVDDFEIG